MLRAPDEAVPGRPAALIAGASTGLGETLARVDYAAKAYVLHLSESGAHEVRGSGVTVTALCPGPTRTEFHERADMEEVGPLRWLVVMDTAAPFARRGWEAAAAMAGRRVVVPGLTNKLGVFALRFILRGLAPWIVAALQRPPAAGAGEVR